MWMLFLGNVFRPKRAVEGTRVAQVSLLRPGFPPITTHPKVADMLCARYLKA